MQTCESIVQNGLPGSYFIISQLPKTEDPHQCSPSLQKNQEIKCHWTWSGFFAESSSNSFPVCDRVGQITVWSVFDTRESLCSTPGFKVTCMLWHLCLLTRSGAFNCVAHMVTVWFGQKFRFHLSLHQMSRSHTQQQHWWVQCYHKPWSKVMVQRMKKTPKL